MNTSPVTLEALNDSDMYIELSDFQSGQRRHLSKRLKKISLHEQFIDSLTCWRPASSPKKNPATNSREGILLLVGSAFGARVRRPCYSGNYALSLVVFRQQKPGEIDRCSRLIGSLVVE